MSDFKIGDLVTVGPAYQMGGTFAPDKYTGRTMRIVELSAGSPRGAELAPADIVNADSSDAEVWINLTRLTSAK